MLAAALLIQRVPEKNGTSTALVALAATFALTLSPEVRLWQWEPTGSIPIDTFARGVGDAREEHWRTSLANIREGEWPIREPRSEQGRLERLLGRKFGVGSAMGFRPFVGGPGVYYLDKAALADPLMSRIPFRKSMVEYWRAGHYRRKVPPGYEAAVLGTGDEIKNRVIREYYKNLRVVIRDPVWSWHRLWLILKMNFGSYGSQLRDLDY